MEDKPETIPEAADGPNCPAPPGSECGDCGEPLTEEEIEYPWTSPYGEIVCSSCENKYKFDCAVCDEMEDNEHQHNILVVFSPDEVFRRTDMSPGLYRIVSRPYWMDGMVEAYVIDSAVEWYAPLPEGAEEGWYPAGHLCRECIKRHGPSTQNNERRCAAEQPKKGTNDV